MLNKHVELIIEGRPYKWAEQYITGEQLKRLANLPLTSELYLAISEPWKDELIQNADKVDLARPAIEQFFIKQALKYTIDGKEFETSKQYISGKEIRKQGRIPVGSLIFLSIKGPWEDELIKDETLVDLARPGIEHFFSKEEKIDIILIVNGRDKPWMKKQISFEEVVALAGGFSESPQKAITVTYKGGPESNPAGIMDKGDIVNVKNKMIFNVSATDKS